MDKLKYTILYANNTHIIVTSTKYNDLHKTENVTLKLISELFQINLLLFNQNKTFGIKFSCV